MDELEAALDTWVTGFITAERAPDHIDAWVDRTWTAIAAEVPEIADDADLATLIRTAISQHWQAFLDVLSGGTTFSLVPAAVDLAHELARRHLGLTSLFSIYRAAQRASWTYATEVVQAAPDSLDHEAILVIFWTQAGDWLDASVEESLRLHQEEAARIERRGDAQRFEAVQALLTGEAGDAHEPRELSATLGGYPVTGTHVALVLTALTSDALTALEPTAHKVAAQLGSRAPLVVRPSGREIWCWVPVKVDPEGDLLVEAPSIRVTVAGPHPGVDGFVLAHQEARAAVPAALARGSAVTTYDEVAALIALHASPASAERFTRRVLGPLADPEHAHLRQTALTVITTPGSADQVATVLGLHKNTVRYRMAQVERLLGRPVQHRIGDLVLALEYAGTFL
ncbi:helix-turn-helix domain-containing protein [Nocardioides sp.]|uniref:PucR family transcriptional regulator n=1 Tax=Nocardioides sp. TaxID=35761 RepID=UPI00260BFA36|nr:helix-turn-helix domain-containing protein [Nocardioides sp.]